MAQFIYDDFACISANDEEIIFSNGRGEIRLKYMNFDCIPMKKYKFSFMENNNGVYTVFSFENDKFNNFHVGMKNESRKGEIEIVMHLDAYNNVDMKSFKRGIKFNLNIKD